MKKYTIILLLLLMPLSAWSDDRIVMVSVPFLNTRPVTIETGTMTMELIRTHLINSQKLKIIEDPGGARNSRFLSITKAVVLGQKLKADFILTGKIGIIDENRVLAIRIVNTYSEQEILGQNFIIDDLKSDTKEIGQSITNALKVYTDVTITDIQTLVDGEEWARVLEQAAIFKRRYPNTETFALNRMTKLASLRLSATRFEESKRYMNSYFFRKARRSINSAIRLQPGNRQYKAFRQVINRTEKKHTTAAESVMIKTIRQLIAEEEFKSASDILERLEKQGSKRKEIITLRKKINLELAAENDYQNARRLYKKKKFSQALIAIKRSIRMNSNRQRYHDLKERIERKSIQYKKNRKTINKYFAFIDQINIYNVFLENKGLKHFESISYIKNDLSFIDPVSNTNRKKYTLNGVEASLFWHFPMPYVPSFSESTSLHLTAIGSAFMAGTNSEKAGTLGADDSLDTALLYNLGFSAAGGPTIRFLSYYFGMGLGIETGYLLFKEKQDPLFTASSSVGDTDNFYRLAIGFELWLAWVPLESIQFFLRYRTMKMGLWGSSDNRKKHKYSSLSLGFGYRFF